jgi:hypothetical protein
MELSPSLEQSRRLKYPAAFLHNFAECLDGLHEPDAHLDFPSCLLFAESAAYLHLIVRNYCPVNEDSGGSIENRATSGTSACGSGGGC